jgi:type VI secretion system protein ImpE
LSAIELLRGGDVATALERLKDDVRNAPHEVKHRVFLFQMFAITGDWDRAMSQLKVASEMDVDASAMADAYKHVLQCEALREQVFRGERLPLVFGEPESWMAKLIEAVRLVATADYTSAAALRSEAFDEAGGTSGSIALRNSDAASDETVPAREFEWIADADSRLGPFLEVIQQGKYYWVPFSRISRINFHAATDLRDYVWIPAEFTWVGGGEMVGMIPTRYPDSHADADPLIQLARKTRWDQKDDETYLGYGQRMFTTNIDDFPILDVASISLEPDG